MAAMKVYTLKEALVRVLQLGSPLGHKVGLLCRTMEMGGSFLDLLDQELGQDMLEQSGQMPTPLIGLFHQNTLLN